MRVREYFTNRELMCRCGCGVRPGDEAIEKLYALRMLHEEPIPVRSGARCRKHNKAEGGKSRSRHITQWVTIRGVLRAIQECDAFDLETTIKTEGKLVRLALLVGFRGIGIKDNDFLHIDLRRDLRIWTY